MNDALNTHVFGADKGTLDALIQLSGALAHAMISAVVVGIIVVCVVEVFKIPMRALFHFLMLWRWLRSLKTRPHAFFATQPVNEFITRGHLTLSLPGELFLKQIENLGRAALEQPSEKWALEVIAAGASPADLDSVFRSVQENANPGGEPKPDQPSSDSVFGAQSRTASVIERNLDNLQLTVAFWWPVFLRGASAVLAIILVYWAAATFVGSGGQVPVIAVIIIGLVAGYSAALIHDLVGIIRSWRGLRA